MNKKLLDVEFEGIDSGDCESQCWAVDAETFERLNGHPPARRDMEELDEGEVYWGDVLLTHWESNRFNAGLFDYCPSYIPLDYPKGKKVKVRIIVEEIEE